MGLYFLGRVGQLEKKRYATLGIPKYTKSYFKSLKRMRSYLWRYLNDHIENPYNFCVESKNGNKKKLVVFVAVTYCTCLNVAGRALHWSEV